MEGWTCCGRNDGVSRDVGRLICVVGKKARKSQWAPAALRQMREQRGARERGRDRDGVGTSTAWGGRARAGLIGWRCQNLQQQSG